MTKPIAECSALENELRTYKLWANLIPKTTWENNLRKVLSREEWDILRRKVYERANHQCHICKATGVRLEAHEEWTFDYENAHQRLKDVIALCKWCHHCQHLGFANILIRQGKLDPRKLLAHWCKVNNQSKEEFLRHKEVAFQLWRLKNQFSWILVDQTGEAIEKSETAAHILQLIDID